MASWDKDGTLRYSSTIFHSPPTSVYGWRYYRTVACRVPSTLNLRDGRIITWYYRKSITDIFHNMFWNQAPLGQANYNNTYSITFMRGECRFYRFEGGLSYLLNFCYVSMPNNIWFPMRITWYYGKTPAGDNALVVEIADWLFDDWRTFVTFYDVDPLWLNSPTKRVGFTFLTYLDDTEIWQKT